MRTHARLSDEGIYKAQTRGVPKWRLQVRLNKLGAEASGFKCRNDLVFVVGAVGLDGHAQFDALIAVRIHELVVVEANDVAVHAGDGLRNANELAGTIGQKRRNREHAVALDEAVLKKTIEDAGYTVEEMK